MYDPLGEKLLTRFRLNFSHLKKYNFRHGFDDRIYPMCTCRAEFETTKQFLLRYHFLFKQRPEHSDSFEKGNSDFKNLSDKDPVSFML